MKRCTICGDKFTGEEISEWSADHEDFWVSPLVCPDCYARETMKDLEDQFADLMEEYS